MSALFGAASALFGVAALWLTNFAAHDDIAPILPRFAAIVALCLCIALARFA